MMETREPTRRFSSSNNSTPARTRFKPLAKGRKASFTSASTDSMEMLTLKGS
jgi:hypothetical protein